MTVVAGVMMCKDEADVIETTLRHMLTQVDAVVVSDNMSTDGTIKILERLAEEYGMDRFELWSDPETAYYQSKKMTRLAHSAHTTYGADWIVPFDADEIWYSSFAPALKDRLAALGEQWQVVQADLYDHVPTSLDNTNQTDVMRRLTWRSAGKLDLPKVACRWRSDLVIDYGNHRAFYDESGCTVSHDRFVVRHFPYRSPSQFISKIRNGYAAYQAAPELEAYGGHWKSYGQMLETQGPDVVLDNVFYRFFYDQDPANSARQGRRPLVDDPAPIKG